MYLENEATHRYIRVASANREKIRRIMEKNDCILLEEKKVRWKENCLHLVITPMQFLLAQDVPLRLHVPDMYNESFLLIVRLTALGTYKIQ